MEGWGDRVYSVISEEAPGGSVAAAEKKSRDSSLFTSTQVTWRMRLSQRWLVEDMELLR